MENEVIVKAKELLSSGISEHGGGALIGLNKLFDDFEIEYGTYKGEYEEWIHYTRNFIDSWIDASNHDWNYHEPIAKDDWVGIAKQILESIEHKRKFTPVLKDGKQIKDF